MTIKEREDVIKALECCTNESESCAGCPFIEKGACRQSSLLKLALALIKELTEEIKDLEADYDRVYEQAEADIHGNMADGGTSCHWCMDKTKVDTVKMMQSKLTDTSEFMLRADHNGAMYYVDHAAWVEEIAKEILEGNNYVSNL